MIIDRFVGQYAFLSNFAPVEIFYEGITFRNVEAAFQSAKTEDRHERLRIAAAVQPGQAKRLGQHVVLRGDWEEIKCEVMDILVTKKFACEPLYTRALRSTNDALLVEGNYWHDTFWGFCFCPKCNRGQNRLGTLLMLVRCGAGGRAR